MTQKMLASLTLCIQRPVRHDRTIRSVTARVVVVTLLLASSACSFGGKGANDAEHTITARGGTIGSLSGPAQLIVPAGVVAQETKVRISAGPTATARRNSTGTTLPSADVSAWALPLGPIVEITPSTPLTGISVSIPVDITRLQSSAGRKATPENVFLAIWEDALGAWLPLETTFEAKSGRAVALAPHFSKFQAWVVDPGSAVWTATKSGASALKDKTVQSFEAMISGAKSFIADSWSPEQKEYTKDCPSSTGGWSVSDPDEHISGCVVPEDNPQLYLRNGYLFAYEGLLPKGETPDTGDGLYPDDYDAASVLARMNAYRHGHVFLAGRGRERVTVPEHYRSMGSDMQVEFMPSTTQLSLDAALAALNWLPGAKIVRETLVSRELIIRLVAVAREEGRTNLTIKVVQRETITQIERKEKVTPEELETIKSIFGTLSCTLSGLESAISLLSKGTPADDLVEQALKIGKECSLDALKSIQGISKFAVKTAEQLIATIPSTAKTLRELWQATARGLESWGAMFTMHVAPPGVDPVANSIDAIRRFLIENSNITVIDVPESDSLTWSVEGKRETVRIACSPPGMLTGNRATLCMTGGSTMVDSIFVAVRLAPGGAPTQVETIVLTGSDLEYVCEPAWANRLVTAYLGQRPHFC